MDKLFSEIEFIYFTLRRGVDFSRLGPRVVPYIDLTYLIEGEMVYRINGEEIHLSSGDAILVPEGAVRERLRSSAPASYASFNVRLPRGIQSTVCGKVERAVSAGTVLTLESVSKDFNSVGARRLEKCSCSFLYLLNQLCETASAMVENPHIREVKSFIAKHISEPLTLERISDEVHLVPRYLCTLFKRHTGMTVVEYIVAERIDSAKRLILTSDTPLSKISEAVGFTDYNYFTRSFRRAVGMTPREYKKESGKS